MIIGHLRVFVMSEKSIDRQIKDRTISVMDAAGRKRLVIKDESVFQIAEQCLVTIHKIYLAALTMGICPYRYIRNSETISNAEQRELAKSHVAVIGAGGLGGHVLTLLARIGVGRLTVVDKDRFDETNLNRQLLSNRESLGRLKAEEAASVVSSINPGVSVFPYAIQLSEANVDGILTGCHVVVDALDNIPDRFIIEKAAKRLNIPLVHGAVAGFGGQWMVIGPEDDGFNALYGEGTEADNNKKSRESILGVPAIAPAVIAAFQAMEVIKLLLNRGDRSMNTIFHLDLEQSRFKRFSLGEL
jgi:molybdopterin-synthase adenylyltransferase